MITKIKVLYVVYKGNALISVADANSVCTMVLSEKFTLLDKNENKVLHRMVFGHDGCKGRIVEAIDNNSIPKDILTLIKYKAIDINKTWYHDSCFDDGYVLLDLKDIDIVKFKLEKL